MDKRKNKSTDSEVDPAHPNPVSFLREIFLLFLGGSFMFFLSCTKNDITVVNNLTQADTLPSQTIRDLTTIYMDTGRVQMILKAPLVNYYSEREEPVMIFPGGIHVDFYDKNGQVETRLQAGHAIYYQKKNLWEARDSVFAMNSTGERLDAEILFWDITKKRIYSDKFVRITTPDEIIFGEGFESDQAFNDWNINNVRGTVYLQSYQEQKDTTTIKKSQKSRKE
ncbi:MAG TPA: LPS export ABC transporter periplasmic protein LptC [Bacteroidetes bacterium]|nr:LPS export ABC transporter periplasmic protein LptC [Bacteroidota bacterium]